MVEKRLLSGKQESPHPCGASDATITAYRSYLGGGSNFWCQLSIFMRSVNCVAVSKVSILCPYVLCEEKALLKLCNWMFNGILKKTKKKNR